MFRQLLALGVAAFALFPACSSSTSSPGDACSSYASASQARADRCKESSKELSTPEFLNYCTVLISAPGAGFNASKLGACASRLRDLPCNQTANDVAECRSGDTSGTLAVGAACGSDDQCASDDCLGADIDDNVFTCGKCVAAVPVGGACEQSSGKPKCEHNSVCTGATSSGAGGTCVAVTIAKDGELCSTVDKPVRCADGLDCSSAGDELPKCRPPLAIGAACTGHECGGVLACISGSCQLRGGAGTACLSGSECAPDFACDSQAKQCVAVVKAAEGQPCGATSATSPRCNDGLYCGSSTAGEGGTCKAYKPKGAACDAKLDKCTPYTSCLAGKCTLPDPATCK